MLKAWLLLCDVEHRRALGAHGRHRREEDFAVEDVEFRVIGGHMALETLQTLSGFILGFRCYL